ncbi:MAG: hypothetical protein BWY72_01612 [Bacteroidetes bacterium ADurb.Bin416]|nr:MAG: hypothetical protein BWY72_01612 [Bacteroidetes bacterium ADurb.Bin416]
MEETGTVEMISSMLIFWVAEVCSRRLTPMSSRSSLRSVTTTSDRVKASVSSTTFNVFCPLNGNVLVFMPMNETLILRGSSEAGTVRL